MLKKTIKYKDYNGNELEEDFYFHLSKAEIMEMEVSVDGGLSNTIEKIVKSKNVKEIMNIFMDLIKKSYGVKSDDGKRFIKNENVLSDFVQSPAYSELFMELTESDEAASEFIKNIIPDIKRHVNNKN